MPFKTIRNENALPKVNEGLEAPHLPTDGVTQHLGTWVRLVEHQTHATKTHRLNLLRYIHSVGHFLPLRIHLSNSRRWALLPLIGSQILQKVRHGFWILRSVLMF